MKARVFDEYGCNGLDLSYVYTSRYLNLVEVCLHPLYRPLCELCDGSQVCVRFLRQYVGCRDLKAAVVDIYHKELYNSALG